MGEWRKGVWVWKWQWRRELFEREIPILNNLIDLINRYTLSQEKKDQWKWRFSPDGIYSTKIAYNQLVLDDEEDNEEERKAFTILWNKWVPSKVSMHAWRVLWERIPTTTNLRRRNSLPQASDIHHPFCKNEHETVRHVLFECSFAFNVWTKYVEWFGISTVLSSNLKISLLQFSRLIGEKEGKTLMVGLWKCITWTLWKSRNAIIFRNETFEVKEIVEDIKRRMWSWINERRK